MLPNAPSPPWPDVPTAPPRRDAPDPVFRMQPARWAVVLAVIVCAGFAVAMPTLVATEHGVWRMLVFPFFGVAVYLMAVALMARAVADERGLTITSVFESARYSWGEIQDFETGSVSSGEGTSTTLRVLLTSGESVDVPAFFGHSKAEAQRYLRVLRGYRVWYSRGGP